MGSSNKRPSLFKKIDEFIFSKVNDLKKTEVYEKTSLFVGGLDQETRRVLFPILGVLTTLLPLAFILPLLVHNYGLRKEVSLKKEIAESAQKVLGIRQDLSKIQTRLLDKEGMTNQQDFSRKITETAKRLQLNMNSLHFDQFQKEDLPGNIQKSQGVLSFKDLGLKDLTNLINNLSRNNKMKVVSHSIQKDQTKKTLSGTLTLYHYGKN